MSAVLATIADGRLPAPVNSAALAKFVAAGWPVVGGEELRVLRPVEWLLPGLIPMASTAVVYGPPGAGKTAVMVAIGTLVASGQEWDGRVVNQRPVVYVAAESSWSVRRRLYARATMSGIDLGQLPPLKLLERSFELTSDSEIAALILFLKEVFTVAGLVIFDTLAASMVGDENSTETMNSATRNLNRIAQQAGWAVVVVHHSPKGDPRQYRGSSALKGNVDTMLSVHDGRIVIEKARDGDAASEFGYALSTVGTGVDADGKPVLTVYADLGGRSTYQQAAKQRRTDGAAGRRGEHERALFELVAAASVKDADGFVDRLSLTAAFGEQVGLGKESAARQARAAAESLIASGALEAAGPANRRLRVPASPNGIVATAANDDLALALEAPADAGSDNRMSADIRLSDAGGDGCGHTTLGVAASPSASAPSASEEASELKWPRLASPWE